MSKTAKQIYFEFGSFRLYPLERTLEYDGEKLKLSDHEYEILLILVRCRSLKVKVEELIEAIWPGQRRNQRIDNLYVAIHDLKEALKLATPEASGFVKNFRGEGYSFMADVEEHEVLTTVCILPFKTEGKREVEDEIGLEMADTLASLLSGNVSIRVTPLATVLREYREHPNQRPRGFGHRLVVDYVFSGRIWRQQHEQIHVNLELLSVRAGEVVATHPFGEYNESFDFRKGIHKWMQLVLELTPTKLETEETEQASGDTKNQKALKYFRNGRRQRYKGTDISLAKAIVYFQKATEADPEFARAWAYLADTFLFMGMLNLISSQDSYKGAKEPAAKARETGESLASAHAVWAFTKMFFEWRWEDAREGFARAIEIKPYYAVAHLGYAHWLIAQQRHVDAIAEIDHALALDSHSFFISFVRGMVFFLSRQYGRSLEQFEETHRLKVRFNLKSDLSHYGISLAHEYLAVTAKKGERERVFKKADEEAQTTITVSNRHPLKLLHRAHLKAMWGKRDEALELLDEVLELRRAGHYVSPYHLGILYAALEEIDLAFESLASAWAVRDLYLFLAGVDPRLDSLRPDPRFKKLLLSIGLE